MKEKDVITKIENFVYQILQKEGSGHDWWHIERVRRMAVQIADAEHANRFFVELAALLHDLIDDKLPENMKLDIHDVEQILERMGISDEDVLEIINIIQIISFRKQTPSSQLSLEAKVVQDADRLDAIGAIGIARTFAYAGAKGNLIYQPNDQKGTDAIGHFYDKLLKLKDLMNTATGKCLAEERHQYLHTYLEQFYREWNGLN